MSLAKQGKQTTIMVWGVEGYKVWMERNFYPLDLAIRGFRIKKNQLNVGP
jgi:hypothetical protein